jgi:uncharacterized protein (DUF486 family)
MPNLSSYIAPIAMLFGSNVFMTTAWYWHLRYKDVPLLYVILFSWGLALIEYCLAVPANRIGSAVYLKETITWSQGVGFALIAAGAFFVFHKW